MYRYPFAVGPTAFCCWEHDLPERNRRFLREIDTGYFHYIASQYGGQLDGDDRQRAAVALRSAYHHGLETLFSLLGALTQAPGCVPAWLAKCSTSDLRAVVRSLMVGSHITTQVGRQQITVGDLSEIVHQFCWTDEVPVGATHQRFARLWSRLADEYLDGRSSAEYNSIKHGFRVAAGGFTIRIGREESFGVHPPESAMQTLGGSPFGTSFFVAQPIVPEGTAAQHFRIRHSALNWSPEAMIQRLHLIAMSITNVVGCLRSLNGAAPETIQFTRPPSPQSFDDAWQWNVGVTGADFDLEIAPTDISPISRSALLAELEGRGSC